MEETTLPEVPGYIPVCRLASGGMGSVDLAVKGTGTFRRFYAVKRIHPHLREDTDYRSMFVDEARVAGLIRHANVVSVLDVGEDEHGPFMVMDYVEGVSLAQIGEELNRRGERVPIQIALQVLVQCGRGLHAAHEVRSHRGEKMGLVHRDVSPPNILLGFDGTIRLTDFGIAKAEGRRTTTSGAVLKGKIAYMSPEQLQSHDVDHRADLFALGVVIFELLSGERLYREEELLAVAQKIIDEPIPDVGEFRTDVPPALTELLFELLGKKRELRPETAHEVALRAEQMLATLSADEGPLSVSEWMAPRFGNAQSERRAQIESELSRVTEFMSGNFSSTSRGGARPTRVWLWASLLAAGIALLSGALWWSVWRPTSDTVPVEDSQVTRTQPARDIPPTKQDVPPLSPVLEDIVVEASTTNPPGPAKANDSTRARRTSQRRAARKARAAGRRRTIRKKDTVQKTTSEGESDRLWNWERK